MIDISKWSVDEPQEVDPAIIMERHKAWQSQIAKLSEEERNQLIEERQRRVKVLRETRKTRSHDTSILKNVVRALPKPRPLPKQLPDTKEWKCKTCKDLGFIGSRNSLPHWHPEFGQAVLCPHCGHARKRVAIERMWPLGEATKALYQKPIRTRFFKEGQWVTQEALVELKHTLSEFIKHLPAGVLVLIEGGYGTVKTHSLAILYDRCWKAGKSAVYVNATDLEKMYTDFSESQRSSYDEIRNEASFTRFNREKSLMETDFLFIDEAHRYTQRILTRLDRTTIVQLSSYEVG